MAALPFHYYLALREDWIKTNTLAAAAASASDDEEDIDFNAKSFTGEMV